MNATSGFKMYIEKDRLLNGIYHGTSMIRKLQDVTAIVTLRDINKMSSSAVDETNTLQVTILSKKEIEDMLRSIRDFQGHEVYADATIIPTKTDHAQVFNSQTFVERDKLVGIYRLNKFFRPFDFSGISTAPACIVRYTTPEGSYVAFYTPPIMEKISKEKLRGPLERVIERAEDEKQVSLPGFDGDVNLNLRELITNCERILRTPPLEITMLRDGTHRSYVTNLAGVSLHALLVDGSTAEVPSIPIDTDELVITSRKPAKPEDRFLGLSSDGIPRVGWIDLKGVGIDG